MTFREHPSSLSILDSLLKNYDRRATPTNHLGKLHSYKLKGADYKTELNLLNCFTRNLHKKTKHNSGEKHTTISKYIKLKFILLMRPLVFIFVTK